MASTAQKVNAASENKLSSPQFMILNLVMKGDGFGPGDWSLLVILNGHTIFETKWHNNRTLRYDIFLMDLKQQHYHDLLAEQPLIFLVRQGGSKGVKEPDPLLCPDNKAGASVDLFPLVLGEKEILVNVPILYSITGLFTGCRVQLSAKLDEQIKNDKVPLILTMISGHCFPVAREGTVYMSAIGLNDICSRQATSFGTSLSTSEAIKVVWASTSNVGLAANSAYNVPNDDKFVSDDLEPMVTKSCSSVYWNSMTRELVDLDKLRERLTSPFVIEIAGVPKAGKIEVRGRYMAFVDAGVLLEPGQFSVTVCARLLFYNEFNLPEGTGALLELPPTSAKAVSARDTDFVVDHFGHASYIVLRFDLFDSLNAKAKMSSLYNKLGFPAPDGNAIPVTDLYVDIVTEETSLDIRHIRKEGGALTVHKELSGLACRGKVQMNQSIKRTAANRLLLKMRSLIKYFPPGQCSILEWQDTITAQHAASRRAITASFAPQSPSPRPSSRIAVVRSLLAGDIRIAEEHIKRNLAASHHPRVLLSKTLRCLEEKKDYEAFTYLKQALSAQVKNRYLLWLFGGLQYDIEEWYEVAAAAFHIAVKGDTSDGTMEAVGWAALHALQHYNRNSCAAFVAARKMRKAYELPREWKKFLQRWVDISGEEEIFWIPATLHIDNPMLLASAFFLCLRCYKFSERLLRCVEEGCASRGARCVLKNNLDNVSADIYYIRAASSILQRDFEKALDLIEQGIKQYGPSAMMLQIRAVTLICLRGWDPQCESALLQSERAGAETCPLFFYQAALGVLNSSPSEALQLAARVHKVAPSPHLALVIARAYAKTGGEELAERWAAAAVKTEPLLADGWAFLAIQAMCGRHIDKAKAMLRTAKQAGPISSDIKEELRKVKKIVPMEASLGTLIKDVCFCEYY